MPVSLNHLNLVVSDLDAAEAFFQAAFGFEPRAKHAALTVLDGQDGFTLVLMRSRNGRPVYPAGFHIGFLVDDEPAVDAEYRRLGHEGVTIPNPPKHMRGTYGFYFTALDEILFEVSAR